MDNINEKEELIGQLKFMISTSPEELYRMLNNGIPVFIKSAIIFGIDSDITKECLNVLKDMIKIILKERKMLLEINKNRDTIEIESLSDVIGLLDELNEKTYNEYDNILTDIEIACDLRDKRRFIKRKEPIDSIISNKEYEEYVKKIAIKKRN